ncbi:hypothetical protein EDB82DRAFT_487688, partial [Fusarium venenatum]|uniref:uncharacterized protein n=1 Tax=Fusarium venenatum TaxID=56646 RepID=UPI001DED0E24
MLLGQFPQRHRRPLVFFCLYVSRTAMTVLAFAVPSRLFLSYAQACLFAGCLDEEEVGSLLAVIFGACVYVFSVSYAWHVLGPWP